MGLEITGRESVTLQIEIPQHKDFDLQDQKALREAQDKEEGDQDWQGAEAGLPDGHRNTGCRTVYRCSIGPGERTKDNLVG